MPRPIRATISRAALAHNLTVAKRHAGRAKVWAVTKANAYGHGIERAARAFEAADGFAVLDFAEAERLRHAGVKKPVLMLEGFFEPADIELLSRHALTPVIHSAEQVKMLAGARLADGLDLYLKVNSGMNRLGFAEAELGAAYKALRAHPKVRQITFMTHFADADGASGVAAQLASFEALTQPFDVQARCIANSAALIRFPEARADWVRPGIMLYGGSPFADLSAEELGLKPAMTLTSQIIGIQKLERGERIGYGFAYEATGPMTVAIVACGYADGYPRHAPTGTPVLVNGKRARLVGRVSMDMISVDVSDLTDARIGIPVTLWGEGLPADEVGAAAGTLSYELFTKLTARVPVVET
jgi:alanine racemase